jgi:hypothetical protein
MPGQHSDEERERKERIKKLKAKTSKMRLAAINRPWAKKSVSDFSNHLKSQFPNPTGKSGRPGNIQFDEMGVQGRTGNPISKDFMGLKENRDNYSLDLAKKYQFETPLGKDERRYISEQEKREVKGLKRQPYFYPDGEAHEAVVKKKSSVYGDYLPPKEAKPAYKELFKKNNITNPKEFNDYADKNKKVLEKSKLPGKDYLSVYSLDNAKKYKKTSD